jgi:hypothetical protein
MPFGEVERGEVEVVRLDVGTFGDRKTHIREDRGDLVDHLAHRMDAAGRGRRRQHRQRDIDAFALEPGGQRLFGERRLAGLDLLGDLVLEPVDQGPGGLAFLRAHAAERAQQRRDGALLAERGDAHSLDGAFVAGSGDGAHQLGAKALDFCFKRHDYFLMASAEEKASRHPGRAAQGLA